MTMVECILHIVHVHAYRIMLLIHLFLLKGQEVLLDLVVLEILFVLSFLKVLSNLAHLPFRENLSCPDHLWDLCCL